MDIFKKVKSILRPFAVMYVFSFIVSYVLSSLGIGAKHAFEWTNFFNPLYSRTFFNGPLWFLLALFWAFLLFYALVKLCKGKELYLFLATLMLGCIGFYLDKINITLPLFIGQGFVGCPMLMIGYLIKKYIGQHLTENRYWAICIGIVGILLFVILSKGLSMQSNSYEGFYPLSLLGITGGSLFFLSVSVLLEKYLPFVAYWGRYSLIVLCLHNFILIPITKIVAKFVHQSEIWAIATFIIVYLVFLVVVPMIAKFTPSLFNIKSK